MLGAAAVPCQAVCVAASEGARLARVKLLTHIFVIPAPVWTQYIVLVVSAVGVKCEEVREKVC